MNISFYSKLPEFIPRRPHMTLSFLKHGAKGSMGIWNVHYVGDRGQDSFQV